MNTRRFGQGLLVAATLLTIATVIAAVVVMGTPAQQRALRLDQRRTTDLERIVETAREHAERTGALAADLTTLATRPGLRLSIIDPDTAQPYGYKVLDAHRFQVCASFTTDTAREQAPARQDHWLHGTGQQCFIRSWKPASKAD
jgi:hypothetical protein